ncbi:MaoC/PaaZ C-terminal domain-containing protein [Gammaproteobacteria bacterium]|nr:MaoC/PaaZ C-terminal domain-containing protein [Gammaproteobacteria bacterium]
MTNPTSQLESETVSPAPEQLSELPSLMGLFRKAMVKSDTFQLGQPLPFLSNYVKGVQIDHNHLRAYQKLLGFDQDQKLPPTYLSMLGFPMILQIMIHPDFPMKAMGQVHLSNEITVFKNIPIDQPMTLTAGINNNRITAKGVEWSLGMIAKADGELVWSSGSTMLHRCKTDLPRKETSVIEPAGESQMWAVDAGMGRRYASVSGDYNPIHLSALSAKLFGFKKAIVHGMWSKARCLAALKDQLPAAGYRVKARFHQPLFLPSNVLFYSQNQSDKILFSLFDQTGEHAHMDGFISQDLTNAEL